MYTPVCSDDLPAGLHSSFDRLSPGLQFYSAKVISVLGWRFILHSLAPLHTAWRRTRTRSFYRFQSSPPWPCEPIPKCTEATFQDNSSRGPYSATYTTSPTTNGIAAPLAACMEAGMCRCPLRGTPDSISFCLHSEFTLLLDDSDFFIFISITHPPSPLRCIRGGLVIFCSG